MDEAILTAYGWYQLSDFGLAIDLRHDFYELEYLPENDRVRYTIHPTPAKNSSNGFFSSITNAPPHRKLILR